MCCLVRVAIVYDKKPLPAPIVLLLHRKKENNIAFSLPLRLNSSLSLSICVKLLSRLFCLFFF